VADEKRTRPSDDDTRRDGPAKVMRKNGPMSGVGEEAGESNGSSVPEGFETAVGAEPVKLDGSKLSADPQKRDTPQKRTQKPPVGQAAPIKAMEVYVP